MTVKETIELKINQSMNPKFLEVIDQSHQHAGHSGARPEGETHFHINMKADEFNDLNRVARQRLIYKILEQELNGPIHALSLSLDPTKD